MWTVKFPGSAGGSRPALCKPRERTRNRTQGHVTPDVVLSEQRVGLPRVEGTVGSQAAVAV